MGTILSKENWDYFSILGGKMGENLSKYCQKGENKNLWVGWSWTREQRRKRRERKGGRQSTTARREQPSRRRTAAGRSAAGHCAVAVRFQPGLFDSAAGACYSRSSACSPGRRSE